MVVVVDGDGGVKKMKTLIAVMGMKVTMVEVMGTVGWR